MTNQSRARLYMQELKVKGEHAADKVRDIVKEGKSRRIIIKRGDRTLMDIPLAAGAGGTAALIWLAPAIAALGAVAALVTEIRILFEKVEDGDNDENKVVE